MNDIRNDLIFILKKVLNDKYKLLSENDITETFIKFGS